MIQRPSEYLVDGMPTDEMLRSVMSDFLIERTKLHRLKNYYDGKTPILMRTRSSGLPNNRLAYPYARYIASITSGYLAGEPVQYSTAEESETLSQITDTYKRGNVSSVDAELARNAAIYGRSVEYLTVDAEAMPKTTALSPEQSFVVYDDSHEMIPLFGIYFSTRHTAAGEADGVNLWIMGKNIIRHIHASDESCASYDVIDESEHYFGDVPLIEYWNDENEHGDFESILSLLDAYDVLMSDRINDKEQFVDALLVLTGCTLDTDAAGRTPGQQLREDKALSLPDSGASAQYLTHSLQESDIEILRNALKEDIHKMSMVPDLSDQNFAANASGVAMRYKLWGLEQLTNVKEQWFKEGLRTRLRLFANMMELRGQPALDVSDVEITMSRSLPANVLENVQIAQTARNAGAASIRTLVETWHPDWSEESISTEVDAINAENDRQNAFDVRLGDTFAKEDEGDEE